MIIIISLWLILGLLGFILLVYQDVHYLIEEALEGYYRSEIVEVSVPSPKSFIFGMALGLALGPLTFVVLIIKHKLRNSNGYDL